MKAIAITALILTAAVTGLVASLAHDMGSIIADQQAARQALIDARQ